MTGDLTRGKLTRRVRHTAVAVLSVAMVASVSGCGVTRAALGIHQAPQAKATQASLTVDQAKGILTRAFTAAYIGETKTGAVATTALRTAYTSDGLRAVGGRVKLASVQPAATSSLLLAPHPKLLAVSRGYAFPRFILAQTVASDGALPVLHLLTSPDPATPYRISMSVEMVPPAHINPFAPLGQGSPLVTSGTGLAVAPTRLLDLYAAQLAYPVRAATKPPFTTDSFAEQILVGAAGVAKAVAVQANFTQVHKVVPGSVYALRQANGDALVFGVIERKDSFAVKTGQNVNTSANKAFVLLSGKKLVNKTASITTLEFVVFSVPRSTGNATLVGAREQIVAGSGS
jgi:hypothetical protein